MWRCVRSLGIGGRSGPLMDVSSEQTSLLALLSLATVLTVSLPETGGDSLGTRLQFCMSDVSLHIGAISQSVSWSSRKQIIDEDVLNVLVPDLQNQDPRDRPLASRLPWATKVDPTQSLKDLPIIHVNATHNNTMVTITDHNGQTLAWTSAGAEGFKNARRGTSFAGQSAGSAAARKALGLGLKTFRVKLKGTGPGRSASLRGLQLGGVSIALLQDVTPVPHNGCKPRKVRRL